MSIEINRPRLQELLDEHLDELKKFYQKLFPTKPENSFDVDIFTPVRNNIEKLTVEHYLHELVRAKHERSERRYETTFSISCAHAVEAFELLQNDRLMEAMEILGEARFWGGVAFATLGFERTIDPYIDKVKTEAAGDGGSGKAGKSWAKTKLEVQRLVRSTCPPGRKWEHVDEAFDCIGTEVEEFHRRYSKAYAEDPATKSNTPILPIGDLRRTAKNWMREMADGSCFFEKFDPRKIVKSKPRKKISRNLAP